MTALLATIRTVAEAEAALIGGADIADLKEPSAGALGALDAGIARQIANTVRGHAPASATIGDIVSMEPSAVAAAAERTAELGVDYVKAGFLPASTQIDCARALQPLARQVPLVGVLFADLAPDLNLIDVLARYGFAAVMLD